jgi:hypothetical protein
MVEPLRHRQTKGAATDMFYLTPPRHISTLPLNHVQTDVFNRQNRTIGISEIKSQLVGT